MWPSSTMTVASLQTALPGDTKGLLIEDCHSQQRCSLPLGTVRAPWESSAAWSASEPLLQSRSLKLIIGNIAATCCWLHAELQ